MKVLSLKLKDEIFEDVEDVVKNFHISRNAYINKTLLVYNKLNQSKILQKKLQKESKLVQSVSLDILHELEQIEDDLSL